MTNNYVGKTVKLSILCVIMAATIAFSIWHSCGYCASADDVAQIFRQNEQLFERCQSALEREPAISHIVFREGECVSNVSYYCIDGVYYAGAIPGKELANIVSELGWREDCRFYPASIESFECCWHLVFGRRRIGHDVYDVYKDVYKRECRVRSQLVLLHNLGVI